MRLAPLLHMTESAVLAKLIVSGGYSVVAQGLTQELGTRSPILASAASASRIRLYATCRTARWVPRSSDWSVPTAASPARGAIQLGADGHTRAGRRKPGSPGPGRSAPSKTRLPNPERPSADDRLDIQAELEGSCLHPRAVWRQAVSVS